MTTVYLVRHAEAMGNVQNFFQGRTDCDITTNGGRQLEYLSERFKNIRYDVIYSSPLLRTMKTADAVNTYMQLPIIQDEGLMELDGGAFEGRTWDEIPQLYPYEYDLWKNHMPDFKAENSESMHEIYDRIIKAVEKIVEENKGKIIVIVSHGCAIKNFLAYANGMGIDGITKLGWSDNTAVSKLIFDDDMNIMVEFQNDSSHLPEEYSTLNLQKWWR